MKGQVDSLGVGAGGRVHDRRVMTAGGRGRIREGGREEGILEESGTVMGRGIPRLGGSHCVFLSTLDSRVEQSQLHPTVAIVDVLLHTVMALYVEEF